MDKEQVRNAIHAAFAKMPVPKTHSLIGRIWHDDPKNRPSALKIQGELAGKSWQSLTPEFLASWRYSFCYLSPEAYRYYLPSLLIGAFNDFSGSSELMPSEYGGLMHSTVFDLIPSFWSLYYEGEDAYFRSRQKAFTWPQYRAVCTFLGLVFDRLPHLRHCAAQALHWGWNQIATPARETAEEYYRRLHNFSYPTSSDPDIAALCQETVTAFATTPYPGDNALSGSEQGGEPAEMAMELRGLTWQTLHPDLLTQCDAALSFLTDTGFRYFLPAFLLASLLGEEFGFDTKASPVFHLTYGLDTTGRDVPDKHHINRFEHFDRAERWAIIHYLRFCAGDEYDTDGIHRALARYWLPSVLL